MRPPQPLDAFSDPCISAVIYGPTGVGKTALACSSQRLRTLLVDVDRGLLTARCWQGEPGAATDPIRRELVTAYQPGSFEEVLEAYAWAQANRQRYDLIVIDTATELQRMAIEKLCDTAKVDVPSQREWGIALTMMDGLTRAFKGLGKHLIYCAHETAAEDEYEKRVLYRPAFQGRFKDYYAQHFSLIMRYVAISERSKDPATNREVRTVTRALQCRKDHLAHAKDRSTALEHWEAPNLDALFAKVINRVVSAAQPPEGGPNARREGQARPATASPAAPAPIRPTA